MNIYKLLLRPNKLNDIFTPNSIAKLAYVNRIHIENDLEKYLSITGKQIIIYGHSGSGKTTMIRNILAKSKYNYVKVHCESDTKFNDIILQAFDNLNVYYTKEISSSVKYSISSTLKAEYKALSSSISTNSTTEKCEVTGRVVPPQLTSQKLAHFLGAAHSMLIIEDFHKVASEEKIKIADISKVFIDESTDYEKVRIVCIGAVGTARELVEFDSNLNSRIAEVSVPLLKDDEIHNIIKKGCSLLNISMNNKLVEKIVYYSNNIGSLAHQICYDICYANGIKKTQFRKTYLDEEQLKYAIESYVKRSSDTFTKLYDSIITKIPCGKNILKIFDVLEKESLSLSEIENNLQRNINISTEDLAIYLTQLGTVDYDSLIRFDVNSKKYSISTPFFKAFLKMKFELERYEIERSRENRKNKRSKKYHLRPSYEFNYNESFMSEYIKVLSEISTKQIDLMNKMKDLNNYKK